jgi:hypothetical protein
MGLKDIIGGKLNEKGNYPGEVLHQDSLILR